MISTSSYLILLFNFKIIFPNIKIKNVNIGGFVFFFFLFFDLVKERGKKKIVGK